MTHKPYETDSWHYVPAKHFKKWASKRVIDLVVIHTPDWPELPDGAEGVARYFASMSDGRVASAHTSADSNSVVQSVHDNDEAAAAPGSNQNGWHIEIVGYAKQSRANWRDFYSLATLAIAADAVAQVCIKYAIPTVRLTNDQLLKKQRGIVGHDQVSQVFKRSTHLDPGPNFPWARFIHYVKGAYLDRAP